MPAFYIVYFPNEITARESIEIYIFLPVFPSCELVKWAALRNSKSEQSLTLSRTVKQPIRGELNIIIHDPSK